MLLDQEEPRMTFSEALAEQRWDDHRYYHHNRINQALHLVSALSFIAAYVLLAIDPFIAVMLAWLVAMPSRQLGHFWFEPHDYDAVNQATHEHKEAIKVGYNLRRKTILLTIWALVPALLVVQPTLFGALDRPEGWYAFAQNVSRVWLVLGFAAVVARSVQLFFLRDIQTGLVWATKILTDPFHDVKLYRHAPAQVLRGELWEHPPQERAV
jgi:hypothetical protein